MIQIEYNVLSAILQSHYCRPDVKALLISECIESSCVEEPRAVETFRRIFKQIEIETINDFVTKDAASAPVEARFSLETPYSVLSNHGAEALSKAVGADLFHQALYAKYPDVDRITSVSRVGFNPSMTGAVALVAWQSGPRTGLGTYYWLQQRDGTWFVRQSREAWRS